MRTDRILGMLASVLLAAQIILIFVSWLINAAAPDIPIRSLLGSEGIRWLFGHFTDNLQSSLLIWMILLSIAYGALRQSGIVHTQKLRNKAVARPCHFQRNLAMRIVAAEIIVVLAVMSFLAFMPHAILLNVRGHLFPSSFSQSIVPVLAFLVTACSVTYGVICGTLRSIGEIYRIMTVGISGLAGFVPIYILAVELYCSFMFVLSAG